MRRTDLVAHYGGEGFIVVLPESSAAQAMDKLNAIREAIAAEPLVLAWSGGKRDVAKLTVSIGVSTWREEIAENATALVAEADGRLYEAKHAGRNRVVGPDA